MILGLTLAAFSLTAFSQDNKPDAIYSVGSTKVTVWDNEKNGKYGSYTNKNFLLEKVYKKEGKWETSNSYNLTELLQLRAAIDKAINEEAVKIKED